MDRREFLRTTGAAAAAATTATATATAAVSVPGSGTAIASPAILCETRELWLHMPWLDNGQGFGDSGRRLARRIERFSEGRFRVAIQADPAADGPCDIFHDTAHAWTARHAACAYFGGLPGDTGLSPADFETWLSVGGGQVLWDEFGLELGFKPLLAGHAGVAPAIWSKRPVSGVADFEGAKVFAFGLGAEVARALGAEPVSMPQSQVANALAEDRVRFVEWGGALQSLALGLQRVAPHATGNGFSGNGTALSLSVRLTLWESLSESDRAALTAAATEEYRACVSEQRAHEAIVRRAVREANGVEFAPFPADIADAISRVAVATIAHVAARDRRSARIDRSYMAFRSAIAASSSRSGLIS